MNWGLNYRKRIWVQITDNELQFKLQKMNSGSNYINELGFLLQKMNSDSKLQTMN